MGYPVYYRGAIEVQPPLSDAHAKLVEAFVNLEDSEDLRPTLEAIKSSEEPDLPCHGGQVYISEDRSKVEACQREQRHGLPAARTTRDALPTSRWRRLMD